MQKSYINEEKLKRFYTVKEAAHLLGVSTNTVYEHLNSGSLKGKRLNNRGRFKIPFSEIEPYLNTPQTAVDAQPVAQAQAVGQTVQVQTLKGNKVIGMEVVLGAFIGLIFVYFFSYSGLGSFGVGTNSSSTFIADTTSAVLSYSERTFGQFGDYSETLAIKIDNTIFKDSEIAQSTSETERVLGDKSEEMNLETKLPLNKNLYQKITLAVVSLLVIFLSFLLFTVYSKIRTAKKTINSEPPTNQKPSSGVDLKVLLIVFVAALGVTATVTFGSFKLYSMVTSKTAVLGTYDLRASESEATSSDPEVNEENQNGSNNEKISEEINSNSSLDESKTLEQALVSDTPTGWLRVRSSPSGSEIAKVYPGEEYEVIEKEAQWVQIKLNEEKMGWVSSQFVTIEE